MLTKCFIISSTCVDKQKCLVVLFSKKKSRYEEKLKEILNVSLFAHRVRIICMLALKENEQCRRYWKNPGCERVITNQLIALSVALRGKTH